jgi:phosphatidylglycerol lysyltransferase
VGHEKNAVDEKARWVSRAWIAVRVALAGLAFVALRRELANVSATEVLTAIEGFGLIRVIAAVLVAAASFLTIGIFELMALRDTARYEVGPPKWKVPAGVALMTSFVSNALSQTIGLAVLTGSAIRMRVYSRYRMGAGAVARVSGFVTITATLGLLAAGAVALVQTPASLPPRIGVSLKMFGIALSIPAVAYMGWALIGKGTIGRNGWRMHPPSRRVAVAQVVLSVADWLLTGAVLFILLPASSTIGFAAFLGIYLVAQTAGVVSHVPGGFGVFEGAFISLITLSDPTLSTGVVAASLVVYRVVYYLLPLAIAMVIAAVADLRATQPVIVLATARPAASAGLLPKRVNVA